jgi:hypothetical protein
MSGMNSRREVKQVKRGEFNNQSDESGTSNIEHPTTNIHLALGMPNIESRTSKAEHRKPNIESRTLNAER